MPPLLPQKKNPFPRFSSTWFPATCAMDPSTSHSDRVCNAEKNLFLNAVYAREESRQSREGLWRRSGIHTAPGGGGSGRRGPSRTATRLGFSSTGGGQGASTKLYRADRGPRSTQVRPDLGLMFTVQPRLVHKPKQYGLEAPLTMSSSAAVSLLLRSHSRGGDTGNATGHSIQSMLDAAGQPTKEQLTSWREELKRELYRVESEMGSAGTARSSSTGNQQQQRDEERPATARAAAATATAAASIAVQENGAFAGPEVDAPPPSPPPHGMQSNNAEDNDDLIQPQWENAPLAAATQMLATLDQAADASLAPLPRPLSARPGSARSARPATQRGSEHSARSARPRSITGSSAGVRRGTTRPVSARSTRPAQGNTSSPSKTVVGSARFMARPGSTSSRSRPASASRARRTGDGASPMLRKIAPRDAPTSATPRGSAVEVAKTKTRLQRPQSAASLRPVTAAGLLSSRSLMADLGAHEETQATAPTGSPGSANPELAPRPASQWSKRKKKKKSARPKSAASARTGRNDSGRLKPAPGLRLSGRSTRRSGLYRSAPSLAPPHREPFTQNSLGSGLWCTYLLFCVWQLRCHGLLARLF